MLPEVFSEEWSLACRERLNARPEYARAAAGWEAPVVLVMRAGGEAAERAVYLDLFRGECREARVAQPDDFERAVYVLAAEPAAWRKMLGRELEPVTAVLFGKLRLQKGSLASLMPYAAAAREMVAAAADVPARFPGE